MPNELLTNLIKAKLDLTGAVIRRLPQPARMRAEKLRAGVLAAARAALAEFAQSNPGKAAAGNPIRRVIVE